MAQLFCMLWVTAEWQTDGRRSIIKALERSFLLSVMNRVNFHRSEAELYLGQKSLKGGEVERKEKMPFFSTVLKSSSLLDASECSMCCGYNHSLCGCRKKQLSSKVKQAFPLVDKMKHAVFLTLSRPMQYNASVVQGKIHQNSEI